jgi:hypothetical protein
LRTGGGGGAGWYGGGGGAGHISNTGGGGGGSSRTPEGGTVALVDRWTPPRVEITPYHRPPPGCSDGADNDADGLVDHPADPGCVAARDEDEWNPDTFPPGARLSAPRRQRLGRSISVDVSCLSTTEDCVVSATGTLTIGRAARVFKLSRVPSGVVPRASKRTVRLRMPRRTRSAAAKGLRASSAMHADVHVRVADVTGNVRRMSRRIRLVR